MKIQRTNKKRIYVITCCVATLLIAGGALAYYSSQKTPETVQVGVSEITKEENETNQSFQANQKQSFNDQAKESVAHNPNSQNYSETKPQPITTNNISIELEDSIASVSVITNLSQAPSGTCSLETVNISNDKVDKQTAQIIYQPEFSSCAGFTISKEVLGIGLWNIKLTVESDGVTVERVLQHHVK